NIFWKVRRVGAVRRKAAAKVKSLPAPCEAAARPRERGKKSAPVAGHDTCYVRPTIQGSQIQGVLYVFPDNRGRRAAGYWSRSRNANRICVYGTRRWQGEHRHP